MFYYYEKAGKLLASERRDLPYLKAEPAPGTPICYLVEGDPVLGRGSFKVTHPGQLKACLLYTSVEGLTLLSVDHSIQLMHMLSNERRVRPSTVSSGPIRAGSLSGAGEMCIRDRN